MRNWHRQAVILALALIVPALANCARESPPARIASPPSIPPRSVTIVAVRPIGPALASGQRDWRAGVLTALGQADRPAGAEMYEFIVRDQDGTALSVVQSNHDGLRAGRPALMLPGPRARLTPART